MAKEKKPGSGEDADPGSGGAYLGDSYSFGGFSFSADPSFSPSPSFAAPAASQPSYAPSPADLLGEAIENTVQAPAPSLVDLAIEQSSPANLLQQAIENTVQAPNSLPEVTVSSQSLAAAGLALLGAAGTVVGGIAYGLGSMFDYAAKPRRGEIPIRTSFDPGFLPGPPINPPPPTLPPAQEDIPYQPLPDLVVSAPRGSSSNVPPVPPSTFTNPFAFPGLPFGTLPAGPRGSPGPRRQVLPSPGLAAGLPGRLPLPKRRPGPVTSPPAAGPLTGSQPQPVPSTKKKPAPETRKGSETEPAPAPASECPSEHSSEHKRKYGCEQGYYRETETGIVYKKWSTRKCPSSKVSSRSPQQGRPITS